MKKVELSGVNAVNFTKFIGMLSKLSPASTVYFVLDKGSVSSDSFIESKSLIKSLRFDMVDFFEEDSVEDTIKCTFYSGKKLKDAFSYLNGTDIKVTINYEQYEDDYFCSQFIITDGKLSITLNGGDPALIEFASVPQSAIDKLTNVDSASNSFQITSNELRQIKSLEKFDTNPFVTISINGGSIKVKSRNSFEIDINDNMDQVVTDGDYKIDKALLALVEDETYSAYTLEDRVILKSVDEKITNVVALTDTVD